MDPLSLALAAVAAFALAVVSAVAGFGGGVVLLPVFTALFGLRVAVPVLTLAQLVSNGSRVALNSRHIEWRLVRNFALGAVPTALAFGLLFATAPAAGLQRVLGVFLLAVVVLRHVRRRQLGRPSPRAFVAVGAASGAGSALLGSVGPLTAPFFLAYGLVKDAYIGTEAAGAVVMHAAKLAAYGTGDLVSARVAALGAVLAPATMLGAWTGKRLVHRMDERVFTVLVEVGLVVSGVFLVLGA
ncbi:sulfite exporter TauE/SafE family protein [Phycicoccus sp. 3266]|uniref:sulfite exporter TauE/SafE family protein n=1 Tax=Phycicoccus sp. 3266 TaxID=2817751 RepID=UPI00285F9B14|nr:sulfite exporter TauE/SafE family protein [Phycicoccus sp. 3266]MDR6864679.1 putative membrane protein YfcA [Phycicoccus sp. 3266]